MGLWSTLVESAQEANEAAHGDRLEKGLASTLALMTQLDGNIRAHSVERFIDKRNRLKANMVNWSRDGRVDMGRALQNEARKQFDLNQAESYALWLAGAWIESGERRSARAQYVHDFIESFARQAEA